MYRSCDILARPVKKTILLLFLLAAACTTAQMPVAEPLTAITPFDVEGANPRVWNRPLRFGPFNTVKVDEGVTFSASERVRRLEAGLKFQTYRFGVSSGEDPVNAECSTIAASLSRKGLSVDPSFGKIPTLVCSFRGNSTGEGTLWLETTATNKEEGDVDYPDGSVSVRSVHQLGARFGYELRKRDRVIGAVETINRGRVWIDPSLSEKDQARVAAIATALLLYKPVGDDE